MHQHTTKRFILLMMQEAWRQNVHYLVKSCAASEHRFSSSVDRGVDTVKDKKKSH